MEGSISAKVFSDNPGDGDAADGTNYNEHSDSPNIDSFPLNDNYDTPSANAIRNLYFRTVKTTEKVGKEKPST